MYGLLTDRVPAPATPLRRHLPAVSRAPIALEIDLAPHAACAREFVDPGGDGDIDEREPVRREEYRARVEVRDGDTTGDDPAEFLDQIGRAHV